MTKDEVVALAKDGWKGLLLAVVVGAAAWYFKEWTVAAKTISIAKYGDHLIIALILGIVIRAIVGMRPQFNSGFLAATAIFLPLGIVLYGITDLDFTKIAKVNFGDLILLLIVVAVYLVSIVWMGKWLKIKNKTVYLTATGSSICGASAIAVAAPTIDAEPDDVSTSLLSVLVAGLVALFLINKLGLADKTYAMMSGMLLQFTGYVKIATVSLAKPFQDLAMVIKTARYLSLFIAIPVFASFVKNKLSIPWYIWAFLVAGIISSFVQIGNVNLSAYSLAHMKSKEALNLVWAIAMAAIGLNTNIKSVFSMEGLKTVAIALAGFLLAAVTFYAGNIFLG